MNDLKNQIPFFIQGEDDIFEKEGIESVFQVMKLAQKQYTIEET